MESIHDLKQYLELIHIVSDLPGRIRIKFSFSSLTLEDIKFIKQASGFENVLKNLPGVNKVRVNPLAFSCVIEYDAKIITQKAFSELLIGELTEESEELLNILEQKFQEWKNNWN